MDDFLKKFIKKLTDTSALDREDNKLREELEAVTALLRNCVDENAHSALNQAEYAKKYSELKDRFDRIQLDIVAVSNKRMEYTVKRQAITELIQSLQKQDGLLADFDEKLWNAMVDKVVVYRTCDITFVSKGGVDWE